MRRKANKMIPKTPNSPKADPWDTEGEETKSYTSELFENYIRGDNKTDQQGIW